MSIGKKISNKLKSKQGASFLIALMVFIVAIVIATTIVSAALTSSLRIHNDQAAEQAHLTLTSAAELVRDEMLETIYEKTSETVTVEGEVLPRITYTGTGTFVAEMERAVTMVENGMDYVSDIHGGNFRMTIQEPSGSEAEETIVEPVEVSFVMKSGEEELYKLIFTFTLGEHRETLFLSMTPSPETEGNTERITWSGPYINGLGQ